MRYALLSQRLIKSQVHFFGYRIMHFMLLEILGILLCFLRTIFTHMTMRFPPPRGSIHNTLYSPVDYNLNAPLADLV